MKKLLVLLLALAILLGIVGCAAENPKNTENSSTAEKYNKLRLTKHNYHGFLSLNTYADEADSYGYGSFFMFKTIVAGASSDGTSTDYKYHDIRITIKYTITYDKYYWDGCFVSGIMAPTEYKIEKKGAVETGTIVLTTDVTGKGRTSAEHRLESDRWLWSIHDMDFDIVDITGYVELS